MRNLARLLAGTILTMMLAPGLAAQERLSVWLPKGAFAAEDAALSALAERFQARTGVVVTLSLLAPEEAPAKFAAALEARSPPDIGFGSSAEAGGVIAWASQGRLDDIAELVAPNSQRYFPAAYESSLLPGPSGKRGHFGLPLRQQGLHAAYWRDMVQDAGFNEADIPTDWKGYWGFWCDKVQPALRAKGRRVYGIAQAAGPQGDDAMLGFVAHISAHDAMPVDRDGRLLLGDARARAALVAALKDYTDIVQKGCMPPGTLVWNDADSGQAFLKRRTPLALDTQLGTGMAAPDSLQIGAWPARPDGKPLAHPVRVTFATLFAEAQNKPRAREFLAYLALPENAALLAETGQGRWFPVLREVAERPYWRQDERRTALYRQFVLQPTAVLPFVYNAKFAAIQVETLWHRAVSRVVLDKQAPEQAVDEMVVRVRQLVEG